MDWDWRWAVAMYAGIDYQKPTDEEQLVKEIKRRKNLTI